MDESLKQRILELNKDWPRPILLIIGGLLIFSAFSLLDWVRHQSHAARLADKISNFSQPSLISSPETFTDRGADRNMGGATVLLDKVRVDSVLGDYIFMIDLGNKLTLPVVLLGEITERQPENKVQIEKDQMVRVFGFLLPLDDIAMLGKAQFFDDAEKTLLLSKSYYISGIRVVVL